MVSETEYDTFSPTYSRTLHVNNSILNIFLLFNEELYRFVVLSGHECVSFVIWCLSNVGPTVSLQESSYLTGFDSALYDNHAQSKNAKDSFLVLDLF